MKGPPKEAASSVCYGRCALWFNVQQFGLNEVYLSWCPLRAEYYATCIDKSQFRLRARIFQKMKQVLKVTWNNLNHPLFFF